MFIFFNLAKKKKTTRCILNNFDKIKTQTPRFVLSVQPGNVFKSSKI